MRPRGKSPRTASASVTTGLKCAPERGVNATISAIRAKPVASELASSAIAVLPPARRSPMMPEPTTAASSSAVPTASAAADLIEFLFQRELFQLPDRQGEKKIDAPRQRAERILEGAAFLLVGSRHRGRIGHAPMRRDRFARPHGADLCGRRVAHREDEVDLQRAGDRKLVPAFRARPGRGKPALLQQLERKRIDAPGGAAAGAVGGEAAARGVVEIRLGEDRPRRVAGAEE